jgi:hypothetical protein
MVTTSNMVFAFMYTNVIASTRVVWEKYRKSA